jgi:hypothetical protein
VLTAKSQRYVVLADERPDSQRYLLDTLGYFI